MNHFCRKDLSIIVPVGRSETAADTVAAILKQTFLPSVTEILLVGADLITLKARYNDTRIRFVDIPCRCNPATTRAAGVSAASGNLYLFIDDDIIIDPFFVKCLYNAIEAHPYVGAVGGRLPGKDTAYFARVTDFANFWSQQSHNSGPRDWLYSAALAVNAEVYHEAGGFNTALDVGEDVDLTIRIKNSGCVLRYEAEMVGYHDHQRSSLKPTVQYFWHNGRLAKYQFLQEKKLRVFSPLRVMRGFSGCAYNTLRSNVDRPFSLFVYLPGILLMYLIFNVSLERHYQKHMQNYINEKGVAAILRKGQTTGSSYIRMLFWKDAGKTFKASMYLVICYLKESLVFFPPLLLGIILYLASFSCG